MIPKYPYQVRVTSHNGDPDKHHIQNKAFETVPAAVTYMAATARQPRTVRIELLMILEDQHMTQVAAGMTARGS